jgi:hypothetical protein
MPPNPFRLLKRLELTREQSRNLKKKLDAREAKLRAAMKALDRALKLVSKALDQKGKSGRG